MKRKINNKRFIFFRFEYSKADKLIELAKADGRSLSAYIRRIIEKYLIENNL